MEFRKGNCWVYHPGIFFRKSGKQRVYRIRNLEMSVRKMEYGVRERCYVTAKVTGWPESN